MFDPEPPIDPPRGITCPECDGEDEECEYCDGGGYIPIEKYIKWDRKRKDE